MPPVQRHGCPRPKCLHTIDNRLFCCASDWFDLPLSIRRAIGKTAGMNPLLPERRAAIQAALNAWKAIDGPRAARPRR